VVVWALLTNASDYPRWNSTVTSIEGNIAMGEKSGLKSKLDEKRTFKLKVERIWNRTKNWFGAMDKETVFTQLQRWFRHGNIFYVRKIGDLCFRCMQNDPSFRPIFEQFAADLKKESEK